MTPTPMEKFDSDVKKATEEMLNDLLKAVLLDEDGLAANVERKFYSAMHAAGQRLTERVRING